MSSAMFQQVRIFFAGLAHRGRHSDRSPRRDWAMLCLFFAALTAAGIFYSAVLFLNAGYAGVASTPQEESANGVRARTIDRNRLGEAVALFERLQASFNETIKATSTIPLPRPE